MESYVSRNVSETYFAISYLRFYFLSLRGKVGLALSSRETLWRVHNAGIVALLTPRKRPLNQRADTAKVVLSRPAFGRTMVPVAYGASASLVAVET